MRIPELKYKIMFIRDFYIQQTQQLKTQAVKNICLSFFPRRNLDIIIFFNIFSINLFVSSILL
jgi:hypothetical protein